MFIYQILEEKYVNFEINKGYTIVEPKLNKYVTGKRNEDFTNFNHIEGILIVEKPHDNTK